jgi:hypothetical protein
MTPMTRTSVTAVPWPKDIEDTHGKGHISRHPAEGQNTILITLPDGLDRPSG